MGVLPEEVRNDARGHFKTEQVVNSDDENEDGEEEKQLEPVSIFASKKKLLGLLDAMETYAPMLGTSTKQPFPRWPRSLANRASWISLRLR